MLERLFGESKDTGSSFFAQPETYGVEDDAIYNAGQQQWKDQFEKREKALNYPGREQKPPEERKFTSRVAFPETNSIFFGGTFDAGDGGSPAAQEKFEPKAPRPREKKTWKAF